MLHLLRYVRAEFSSLTSYKVIVIERDRLLVKTRYENNREMISFFKIRTMDDICAMVQAGKAVHLDGCYIKEFSYATIQQRCGANTVLRGFSARGAFFDGDTNFAYARFEEGEKNFRYTRFGEGDVDFSHAHFGEGDVRFDEVHFSKGIVRFSETSFGKGAISFKNAHFGEGSAIFRKVHFGEGNVIFREASFGEGRVDFRGASFDEGSVDFRWTRFGKGCVDFHSTRFGKGCLDFSRVSFGEASVDFSGVSFGEGCVDFSFTRFGKGSVDFRWARFGKGSVDFSHTRFGTGNVDFSRACLGEGSVDFSSAIFGKGNVDFHEASFGKGSVEFSKVNFGKGNVNFSKVSFGEGHVDFSFASFDEGNVLFKKANFGEGRLEFSGVNFDKGRVDFSRVCFGEGNADFSWASFGEGCVDFSYANFGEGYIFFCDTDFEHSKLDFSRLDAPQSSLWFHHCSFYQHDNFRIKHLAQLEFTDCIFERSMLLNSTQYIRVDIRSFSLADTKNQGDIYLDWKTACKGIHTYDAAAVSESMRRFAKIYPRWLKTKKHRHLYEKKICKILLYKKKRQQYLIPYYSRKAKQFQLLKENFNKTGEYDHEDEAFVEYMRCHRQLRSKPMRAGLWILDLIGEYGTKPRRLSCWMGGTVVSFAVIYALCLIPEWLFDFQKTGFADDSFLGYLIKGAYISVMTFLTIGDNNIAAQHVFSGTLIAAEGFIGLFLMSYFIVSLVRKTLR